MKFFSLICVFLLLVIDFAQAEVIAADSNALAIYGSACEEIKASEQSAATRIKAIDKACFEAVSSLSEIVNIKDSFDEHDFNVMIYNIVDEYIEDLSTKTTKQDNSEICIEISGYITPENIGKAIDETIQTSPESASLSEGDNQLSSLPQENKFISPHLVSVQASEPSYIVLSTIFIRPTEFYNNTYSNSHSNILKNILSQSEDIRIVDDEREANFVITPKVLKAKIEPLNKETSRMQMVVALDVFDKNQNSSVSEHQNKLILFNNEDDEQAIAKNLLKQLFEQGSLSVLKLTSHSNYKTINQQSGIITPPSIMKATTLAGDAVVSEE